MTITRFITLKRETIKNARLRIVTFLGKTISRNPINVFDMAEEIDVLLEKNYAVTINTKRPSQYLLGVTAQKVAQSRTSSTNPHYNNSN